MTSLLDRKFLVVTGKGGTGKTTVAAALARLAASRGKRVLLCELDATGDIGTPFGDESIGFDPRELEPGVFVMAMDTERAMQEYLLLNLKVPFTVRLGPIARALDFVATAAPGVREILTIGKLCWEVKRQNYDLVIADAPSTGHVVSQLDSPDSIGELISVGPLVDQTAWMRELLRDPQRTGAVIVTTPEEMPVQESLDLLQRLDETTQTPIAGIVVNRVHPELFVRDEAAIFEKLQQDPVHAQLVDAVAGDVDAVLAAARLAVTVRTNQAAQVERLRAAVDPDLPTLYTPQSFGRLDAKTVTSEMVLALDAEIDS